MGLGSCDSDLGRYILKALEPWELELLTEGKKGSQEHRGKARGQQHLREEQGKGK